MKKILFLLITLLFGCTNEPNNEDITVETSEVATDSSKSTTTIEEVTEDEDTPSEVGENKTEYYEGNLSEYSSHFVMKLNIQGKVVEGSYFYSKYGRSLKLTGVLDSKTNLCSLSESSDGKTTGYFQIKFTNNGISGKWSAASDFQNPNEFTAKSIPQNSEMIAPHGISGEYIFHHKGFIYNGPDEEEDVYQTQDVLRVNKVVGPYFSIYYSVEGSNGHTGQVAGLCKFISSDSATLDIEDCVIGFSFAEKGKVIAKESECHMYHGARAWFGGTLEKQ